MLMPTTGDRSARDCPDCGQPMYWSPAVVDDPDLLVRAGQRGQSAGGFVEAYRCTNGHTSQECPLCGSFDTSAWADTEQSSRYHVICGACGNDSIAHR